ncbi:hypothetical protein HDU84_008975 [Entophlyctis sp. JEL0112]|nr:hypothetical protein HDU84_008975 [Entophlyctis sp. JEL0112]
MATARESLCDKIRSDPFLVSAKLEDDLIDYTLHALDNDVAQSLKVLTNFANWHKENLGHPSARVSIVHVHAYYLAKLYVAIPTLVSRAGGYVGFRKLNAERMGGVPKQFAVFMVMFVFYRILLPAMQFKVMDILIVEKFRFINMRLTMYKALNDVVACIPVKKGNPFIFHNAEPVFVKSFTAVRKFVPDFDNNVFTKGDELFNYIDPAMTPVELGGTVTEEQLDADIEDFIIRQYAVEGLRYSPIDIKNINWKTYRPPGMDFVVRPESAISAKSIDYDAVDAELELQGFKERNGEE